MTFHFVNLVSWKYFYNKSSKNRTIYIDSLSLYLCCRLFRFRTKKMSGINFFHNKLDIKNSFFLLSEDNNSFKNKIVLPNWESLDDINLDNVIMKKIGEHESIVIGISSPKQDYLADLINDLFPKKNIFCLGAAIYTSNNNLTFDKLSLNWLVMMSNDFNRFKVKIIITIKEILSIIFILDSRQNFRMFLTKIKKA